MGDTIAKRKPFIQKERGENTAFGRKHIGRSGGKKMKIHGHDLKKNSLDDDTGTAAQCNKRRAGKGDSTGVGDVFPHPAIVAFVPALWGILAR